MGRIYFAGRCSRCGQDKDRVHRDRRTKQLICQGCRSLTYYYRQKKRGEQCQHCARPGVIRTTAADGKKICDRCYQKYRPPEICCICQQSKPVVKRLLNDNPVCSTCYHRTFLQQRCVICHLVRPIKVRLGRNQIICGNCYGSRRYPEWLEQQQSPN